MSVVSYALVCNPLPQMPAFRPTAWTDLNDLLRQVVIFAKQHGWKSLSKAAISRIHRSNTRCHTVYRMIGSDAFSECFNLKVDRRLPDTPFLDITIHDIECDVGSGSITVYTHPIARIKMGFEEGDGGIEIYMA